MSGSSDGQSIASSIMFMVVIQLKIIWFVARMAWWLLVLLVLSVADGVSHLIKRGRDERDEPELDGLDKYSEDGLQWFDQKSGKWYPCGSNGLEFCTVQAVERGIYWRNTALSRLLQRGAIKRNAFLAVNDRNDKTEAESEFPEEARRNITLDHLDPAAAATDPYNLGNNREMALDALRKLEVKLKAMGWELVDPLDRRREDHWYAKVYQRPMIDWDSPINIDTSAA